MKKRREKFSEEEVQIFWEILSHFYRAKEIITKKYLKYQHTGKVDFKYFDYIVSILNKARELSHKIFRDEIDKVAHPEEDPCRLFDFVLSTIYHEILHVKEYVYILNTYGKYYGSLKLKGDRLKGRIETWINKYTKEIYDRVEKDLPIRFAQVFQLFENCETVLDHIYPLFKDTNLPRIIYCNRSRLSPGAFGGQKPLVSIFERMFEGGVIEGYYTVGKLFLQKGFISYSLKSFMYSVFHYERSPNNEKCKEKIKDIFNIVNKLDVDNKIAKRIKTAIVRLGLAS